MPDQLPEALHLLEECARQLMRTGGMLNKDLAREVTRFVARAKDSAPTTEAVEAAVQAERIAAWKAVDKWLPQAPLSGNGCDQLAQRNGMVLACNILYSRAYQRTAPTTTAQEA